MPAAITRLRRLQQQLAAIPTAAVQETAIVPNAPRPVREDAELSADEIAQFMERGFVALPGIMPDDLRLATCDAVDQLQSGVEKKVSSTCQAICGCLRFLGLFRQPVSVGAAVHRRVRRARQAVLVAAGGVRFTGNPPACAWVVSDRHRAWVVSDRARAIVGTRYGN